MTSIRFSTDQTNWTTASFTEYSSGLAWTTISMGWGTISNGSSAIRSVVYGQGKWVAVGTKINKSSTDAINWTTISGFTWSGANGTGLNLVYGQGKWVASGKYGSVFESTDAVTWTTRNVTMGNTDVEALAYGNGIWVLGGNGAVRSSTDGITWTARTYPHGRLVSAVYGDGKWTSIAYSGAVANSTDAITWTSINSLLTGISFPGNVGVKISYGNGKYVLAGYYGDFRQSTDAVTWTTLYSSNFGNNVQDLKYENGYFIGTYNSQRYSTNGVSWITTGVPGINMRTAAYGNGLWIIAGYSSTSSPPMFYSNTITSQVGIVGNIINIKNNNINDRTIAVGSRQIWQNSPIFNNLGTFDLVKEIDVEIKDFEFYDNETILLSNNSVISSTDLVSWTTKNLIWTTSQTQAPGTSYKTLKYGNGLFVYAGGISLYNSTNGISWTTQTINFGNSTIYALAYGNGIWVIGGAGARMSQSTDSVTWTTVNSNFGTTGVYSLGYGNGTWVAGGLSSGAMRFSTDSLNWTTVTSNITDYISDIQYGQNKWVAVGNQSTSGQGRESTDGITWTTINISYTGSNNIPKSIAYANGIWIIGGYQQNIPNKMRYSTNGTNWTTISFPTENSTSGDFVNYDYNSFLASGAQGSVYRSTDGLNWTTMTNNFGSISMKGIAYGNNVWVASGVSTGTLFYSHNIGPDMNFNKLIKAKNNQEINIFSNKAIYSLKKPNSKFQSSYKNIDDSFTNGAIDFNSSMSTSLTGSSWTSVSITPGNVVYSVDYGDNKFITGSNSGQLRTSTDGISWSTLTSNYTSHQIRTVVYGNGSWVIGGYASGTSRIRSSTDGITWTTSTNVTFDILSGAYGNGRWVFGPNASFTGVTTTDAISWSTINIRGVTHSIAYGNGVWVAGQTSGAISRSTDGISWSGVTSNFGSTMVRRVAYGNGVWFAGGYAQMRTSTDSITWTTINHGLFTAGNEIQSIGYANGFWVLGTQTSNRIYTSTNLTTWTTRVSGPAGMMYSIVYGEQDNIWVGSCDSGIQYSKVFYDYNRIYAIGNNAAYISTDMIAWTTYSIVPDVATINDIISNT